MSPGQYAEHVVIDNKVITLGSEFLLSGNRAVIDTTIIQVDPTSAGITIAPGAAGTSIVGLTILERREHDGTEANDEEAGDEPEGDGEPGCGVLQSHFAPQTMGDWAVGSRQ